MKVDVELVKKLEKLAMVEVENKEEFVKEFEKILDYIESLNELDLEKISPYQENSPTLLREDKEEIFDSKIFFKLNPNYIERNMFKVPKIIGD